MKAPADKGQGLEASSVRHRISQSGDDLLEAVHAMTEGKDLRPYGRHDGDGMVQRYSPALPHDKRVRGSAFDGEQDGHGAAWSSTQAHGGRLHSRRLRSMPTTWSRPRRSAIVEREYPIGGEGGRRGPSSESWAALVSSGRARHDAHTVGIDAIATSRASRGGRGGVLLPGEGREPRGPVLVRAVERPRRSGRRRAGLRR